MNRVLITKVVPVEGAAISKATNAYGRPSFVLPLTYHLADGRTIDGVARCKRKKDVMDSVASTKAAIEAGEMSANFDDINGEYQGITWRMDLRSAKKEVQ